jgi:hypothetical protein
MASPSKYQVYGLDETYPEYGVFTFKVVLNPRLYKTCHDFDVTMVDSSRNPMKFDVKKWGRKINVTFEINPSVADGVSHVTVKKEAQDIGKLSFWVIKP